MDRLEVAIGEGEVMQVHELQLGDRFRVTSYGELELVKLTPCRALVRPTKRMGRKLTTREGETVRFTAPQQAFSISRRTDIE